MIDTTQLTQLISAFRVETEKESISPETVGSLLQRITDTLAGASTDSERAILENWKSILSQLRLVESVQQGAANMEHVNIAMTLRDLANGGRSGASFSVSPATAQQAGVMTAEQARQLASLAIAVNALQLAAVNLANKNTEQDSRLDIIQGGNSVITAIMQGSDHASKVYFNIRKQNLATGEIYNKTNNKEIAAATNEKAGVMTAAQVQALEKAKTDITTLQTLFQILHDIDLVVTGIENRPEKKDEVCIGVEMCDFYTATRYEAGDDIVIPGANTTRAGVMTARHAKRLDDAERDIITLKKAAGTSVQPMYPISIEIDNRSGNNRLRVLGAKALLDAGYHPYLFRLSKKRNLLRYADTHEAVHKGWNRVGQGSDAIKIDNNGFVSISITALKHAEADLDAVQNKYQEGAEWYVNDREKLGKRVVSFGKILVNISYIDENRQLRAHKVRLPFGIAFSKQKPAPRERVDMSQLVTDIATFHVATVPYEHGTKYRWVFER